MSQRLVEEKKAQLVDRQFRIAKGDPAYQIWGMFSYDEPTRYLYNQSLAMILAQQFYVEQWQEQRNGHNYVDVNDLFAEVQPSVRISDRCNAQPICDPNQRLYLIIAYICIHFYCIYVFQVILTILQIKITILQKELPILQTKLTILQIKITLVRFKKS